MCANSKKRICYRRADGEQQSSHGNSRNEDWNSRGAGRLRGPRGDARGNGRRISGGTHPRRSRGLPGGESTTQLRFLQEEGLYEAIKKFAAEDKAIFGTCAGAILLATEVKNPSQESLGLLDMTVLRNGYGRQVHSDVVSGPSTLKKDPLEMVFIRGPIFERIGSGVDVLAEFAGKPALVQKAHILAAAFHPELTDDTTVHQHFLELAAENSNRSALAR